MDNNALAEKLLAEIAKAQDNLQEIKFKFNGDDYIFYFKYMTLLEKVRINQMTVKAVTTVKTDGSTEVKHEKQDHLIPIHTILEKALSDNGKRLFSHTNPKHFELVSKLPAGLSSFIAYEMSKDIFGTMDDIEKDQ